MAKDDDFVEDDFQEDEASIPNPDWRTHQTRASLGQLEAEQMAETPEARANQAVDEGYAPGPVSTAALYGLNALSAGTLPYLVDYISPAEEGATQPKLLDMMDAGAAANPRVAGFGEAIPAVIGGIGGLARAGAQRLGLGVGREVLKQAPAAATKAVAAKEALRNLARTSAAGGTTGALQGAVSGRPGETDSIAEQAIKGGAAGLGLGAAGSMAAGLIKNRSNIGPALQEGWQTAVEGLNTAPSFTASIIRAGKGAKAGVNRFFQPQYTQSKLPYGPPEPPSIEDFMSGTRAARPPQQPRPPIDVPPPEPPPGFTDRSGRDIPPGPLEGMTPLADMEGAMFQPPPGASARATRSNLPRLEEQTMVARRNTPEVPTPAQIGPPPQMSTIGQSNMIQTPDGPLTLEQLLNDPKYQDIVDDLWPRITPEGMD